MKKIIPFVVLLFSLASCYQTVSEPDFDMSLVLPPCTMVALLADMHTIDALIEVQKNRTAPESHLSNEYFHAVLDKHHIDQKIFEESIRYYSYHVEELDKIYEKVVVVMSRKESMIIQAARDKSDQTP